MWKCTKCGELVEDDFEVCWNCGTSSEGVEDPEFRRADQIPVEEMGSDRPSPSREPVLDESTAICEMSNEVGRETSESSTLSCPRCYLDLDFLGAKSFHEGFQWGGLLGDWGEFLVKQVSFDVYVCRRCGRAELFLSGVGEQYRPPKSSG